MDCFCEIDAANVPRIQVQIESGQTCGGAVL